MLQCKFNATLGEDMSLTLSVSMELIAGWILEPLFESSRSKGAKYLLCARIGCLWTVKKAFVTEIVHIREDTPLIRFKGTYTVRGSD
jgi:hypothetical protein